MKVKVIAQFCDKYNLARCFMPGEVVDFEQSRANNIVERGLGVFVPTKVKEEVKAEPKTEEKAKPAEVATPETKETPSVPEVKEKKPRKPRQKKTE